MDNELTEQEKQTLGQALARPTGSGSHYQPLDPSLVRWQLDDSGDIDELKAILKGERIQYNEEKKQYEKITIGEPLMNDYGIRILIDTMMRAVSSKNIKLSNMNQQDVYLLARSIMNEVARLLFINGIQKFAIADLAAMSAIMEIMRANMLAQFKRPFNQGERMFIKGFAEEKFNNQPQNKRFGLF